MAVRLIHDDAVGFVTGVDPDHGHRIKGQVDKVMAEALRHQRSRITRKFVASAFDDTGCCSLNDGDRLIELMAMAREPRQARSCRSRRKCPVHKLGAEQILELGPRGQLKSAARIIATESFSAGTAGGTRWLLDRGEAAVDPGLYGAGAASET